MHLDSGKFDQLLRIEKQLVTQEPVYGTLDNKWVPFVEKVWAEVQDVLPSRGESQAEGIAIAQRPARVRLRYLEGLTSDMRVVNLSRGNRLMKILTQPAMLGRRQWMEFMAADFSTQGNAA